MGACCSKTSSNTTNPSPPSPPEPKFKPNPEKPGKENTPVPVPVVATVTEQEAPKKEVFIVKHRKSQETERNPDQVTRKSTDRKEKVSISNPNTDIPQSGVSIAESGKVVGATVRTSSCSKEEVEAILIQCGRLSRSSSGVKPAGGETPTRGRRYSGSKRSFDLDMEAGLKNDEDETVTRRKPESRVSSPSSRRRRSRERDPQQQRSGSKERGSGSGSGGRRVSRSPNRRSESPNPNSNCATGTNRPGKMVSVPATDKSNIAGGGEAGGVKRIQVKRNAGDAVSGAVGTRTAASPRARSPRTNLQVLNENQNPQSVTLSRSNSRKAEQSPYRRNPLGEIDTNTGSEQPGSKVNKNNNVKNSIAKEAQIVDEIKPAVENRKHNQLVSKTRSSRLSRDLDINPEALLGPNPNPNPNPTSYASLLLEDIQNFHQKNQTTLAATAAAPPAFSLPACVSKACSIMEAVADLNSATGTNQFKKENVMESEKAVNDDLIEPSLHKYVTDKRGGDADNEEHEIESSGSNSFAGSQQLSGWMSSSWEPNSGDSTNCWTSNSRSNGRDEVQGQKPEYPRNGIGRGRLGAHGRSAYSLPNNATVAST
ncbi:uncharacterized protein At1g65710-like [Bidens hawaiensis]|uniref:uncharacterized protein At1g65710-like n=1 Tax=Bidens hawaiensis TaxID=980011 RepID=UPI00404A7450